MKFENLGGYIIWSSIRLENLPSSVVVKGIKLLLKEEFHITLVMAKKLAPLIEGGNNEAIQTEIVEMFDSFNSVNTLATYELTKELRLVKRDDRITLIVMVRVPGLDLFFDELRQKYDKDLPLQPTHITLYSLDPEVGIGILSQENLENESEVIDIPEIRDLL